MHPEGFATSKRNAQPWTSGFVIVAIVVSACASAFGTGVFHALPVYASQYSTAVLADSPSDYWPADDGSGTTVSESAAVGSRNLTFNNPPSWYGSGLVSGSGSAVQGACSTCTSAWPSGVPAALPGSRSEEIWFLSPTGGAPVPQGLISVRQPENGSGGCSEGHTDVIMEPNPNIRVDSLDCFVGEFATDCNFGQNGIPNVLDKSPHLIDVTENSGVVSIYVDAKLCVTGSGANAPISSPDCVAVGAAQCVSGNGTFPITQDSVIGQAALYPSALNITQINNHFQAASASQLPAAQLYGSSNSASPQVPYCGAGDPVNCATGNFTETFDEIRIPGRGSPLDLALTYNSLAAAQNSLVGYGWSFSYGARLQVGSGAATVILGNGNIINFALSNGSYAAPAWVIATLTQNPDGTFTYLEKKTQTKYVFSSSGLLTTKVDRNGFSTVVGYNAANQPVTVTDQSGRALVLAYGANGNLATVNDPVNRQVRFAYDTSGNLSGITDVGTGTTNFSYDASHHVLTATDPRGGVVTDTYDSQGRVVTQIDAMTRKTSFAYVAGSTTITDPNGNQTVEQFKNNEMVGVTRGFGSAQAAAWSFAYDPNTLAPASATDPDNHTTSFTWDSSADLLSVTDADNHSTRFTFDSLSDVTSETDALGVTTTMTYDFHGNLLSQSRPLTGTSQVQTITFLYGDNTHPGDITSISDPNRNVWSLSNDANGNLVSVTDPLGNKTSFGYDAIGRRTSQVSPRGNATGGSPSQYTTTYAYDSFGDLTGATDPLGHSSSAVYDANGNATTVTDPNGNRELYTYDLDNEAVKVVRADGTVLTNGYDASGNLIAQLDGIGNATKYSYDPLNRLSSVTDPLARVTSYTFDGAGNLTTITNASQLSTTYSFDPANSLVGVSYASSNTPNVTINYDTDGRRSSMVDGTGKTTYVYDSLNRLTSITDGAGHSVNYTYDLDNNPTGIGYPNGKETTQAFNPSGQLTAVTDWLNNTTNFEYDPNSNMVTETYPNSTKGSFTYDAANQLNQITDSRVGTTLASFVYSRDSAGQLIKATPTGVGQGTESYTYTSISQVASVNASGYKYDAADNIVQLASGANLVYDAANQLKSLTRGGSTTTYGYDAQGNRISATTSSGAATSYAYDQANRLIKAVVPARSNVGLLAAGIDDSLAVRSDGTVWAWGSNTYGELGNGTTSNSSTPVQVSGFSGATAVAAGYYHSLAVRSDGTVWAWGYNNFGQLGNGTFLTNSSTPVRVTGLTGATSVAAGSYHSAALLSNGSVEAWGSNVAGQLGNGTTTLSSTPVQVSGLTNATAVEAGANHSVALRSDGTVWDWGAGKQGQLGNGSTAFSTTPVQVSNLGSVVAIAAGGDSSYALRSDGTVWAWGDNSFHQLGSASAGKTSTVPVQVGISSVAKIGAGNGFALAIKSDGTGWGWGNNNAGQLGNGGSCYKTCSVPVQISNLTNISFIAGGYIHSLAARADGTVWAWGDNSAGELGNGTTTTSFTPVKVSSLSSVQSQTIASYAYNGDSLRTSKTVNGAVDSFTWDLVSRTPLLIQDGGTQFIYGPHGLPIEQVNSAGTATFLYQDQLGSTRLISDMSGNVSGTFTYDAYGNTTSHTGSASTALQFAGQYLDSETSLYYMRARYFDPATAQFVSRDPLSPSTRQPYGYTAWSPLNGVDPTGLDTALQRAAQDVSTVANSISLVTQIGAIIALLVQAPAAEEGGAGLTVVGALEAVSTATGLIATVADFYYYTQNPSPEALRNVVFDSLGLFTFAKGVALLRLVKGNAVAVRAVKLYIDTQGTLLTFAQTLVAATAGDLTTSLQQLSVDLHCLLSEATAPIGPASVPCSPALDSARCNVH